MPRIDPDPPTDLCALSITDLVDLIARREVSPLEMAHASLARYDATEPDVNAFISLDRNLVIADAARLETKPGVASFADRCTASRSRSRTTSRHGASR